MVQQTPICPFIAAIMHMSMQISFCDLPVKEEGHA